MSTISTIVGWMIAVIFIFAFGAVILKAYNDLRSGVYEMRKGKLERKDPVRAKNQIKYMGRIK